MNYSGRDNKAISGEWNDKGVQAGELRRGPCPLNIPEGRGNWEMSLCGGDVGIGKCPCAEGTCEEGKRSRLLFVLKTIRVLSNLKKGTK
jgi:hypothetical protein